MATTIAKGLHDVRDDVAVAYTAGGASLTLATGQGAKYSSATAAAPYRIRIDDELLSVTNVTGDVLAVSGAQGGTGAANHSAGPQKVEAVFSHIDWNAARTLLLALETAALTSDTQGKVYATPSGASGVPGLRALVAADVPNLDAAKVTTGTFANSLLGGAWTNWTPTFTQTATITKTTLGRYCAFGKIGMIQVRLDATSAGTSGAQIQVGNIPSGIAPLNNVDMAVGSYLFYDASANTYYMGSVLTISGGATLYFGSDANLSLGATPAFAVASGDVFTFTASWEIA